MNQEDLLAAWPMSRVRRLASHFLLGRRFSLDVEDIVMQFYEKCLSGEEPSQTMIKNLCIDHARHETIVQNVDARRLYERTKREPRPASEITQLVQAADLSSIERRLIWLRYWRGMNDIEIASYENEPLARIVRTLNEAEVKILIVGRIR